MRGPGLARTYSMSIVGIEGHLVDVETYAGSGRSLACSTRLCARPVIACALRSSRVAWTCWTNGSP